VAVADLEPNLNKSDDNSLFQFPQACNLDNVNVKNFPVIFYTSYERIRASKEWTYARVETRNDDQ